MKRSAKLIGFITTLLLVLLPTFTLAQELSFSLSPAKVHIDNLPPGATSEFTLTIYNKEELAYNFTLAVFEPPEGERREEGTEFPDKNWITFSSPDIIVAANSEATVNVTVAVPLGPEWAGKEWETWLGATAESSDLLAIRLYSCLLVSTTSAVEIKPSIGLIVGIVVGILLFGFGSYYYYRRGT